MSNEDRLYSQYIYERMGQSSLWRDFGFIAYKMSNKECFLAEMFIHREHRSIGKGRELLNSLIELARGNGAEVITANIYLRDKNSTGTLIAAIACGFEVSKANNDVLLISLKLKEQ